MTIYLVRHAKAGSRRNWATDDTLRPLSKPGRRQADAIASGLAGVSVSRLVSSPFVRCVQTVEPLAAALGVDIERSDTLAEGASITDALDLVDKLAREQHAVVCSHGDVIGDLLMALSDRGVRLDDFRIEKGSTWVLECDDGKVVSAHYTPPADD
ncbi:MAG: phosphoglycerate mutase family protein [Acidimicrobiia bacterium]